MVVIIAQVYPLTFFLYNRITKEMKLSNPHKLQKHSFIVEPPIPEVLHWPKNKRCPSLFQKPSSPLSGLVLLKKKHKEWRIVTEYYPDTSADFKYLDLPFPFPGQYLGGRWKVWLICYYLWTFVLSDTLCEIIRKPSTSSRSPNRLSFALSWSHPSSSPSLFLSPPPDQLRIKHILQFDRIQNNSSSGLSVLSS